MIRGDSIREVLPLFRGDDGGSTPTSPLQLHVGKISVVLASELNKLWHSRLPQIESASIQGADCFGAEYGGIWYATAIWTTPVARMLNGRRWFELRRFAIAPDAPRNTASRMLSVMVAKIRKANPSLVRLISYQDTEVHNGTIYKASGWEATVQSEGGEWSRPSRKRNAVQSGAPKIRWELALK